MSSRPLSDFDINISRSTRGCCTFGGFSFLIWNKDKPSKLHMEDTRDAAYHSTTHGKIEGYRGLMKIVVKLEHYHFLRDLKKVITG